MKYIIALGRVSFFIAVMSLLADAQAQISETDALYYYYYYYYDDEEATLTFDDVIGLVSSGIVYEKYDSVDIPLGRGDHWVI